MHGMGNAAKKIVLDNSSNSSLVCICKCGFWNQKFSVSVMSTFMWVRYRKKIFSHTHIFNCFPPYTPALISPPPHSADHRG